MSNKNLFTHSQIFRIGNMCVVTYPNIFAFAIRKAPDHFGFKPFLKHINQLRDYSGYHGAGINFLRNEKCFFTNAWTFM